MSKVIHQPNLLPLRVLVGAIDGWNPVLGSRPWRDHFNLIVLYLELEGLWSARRGQYRILYRIDEGRRVVEIVTIDHRADV